MRTFILLVSLLLIAGCAALKDSPEGGISSISLDKNGALNVKNSKEYASVKASMETPDGRKYNYEAVGVEAFEGQAIAAQLQGVLSSQQSQLLQALPGIMSGAFGEALKAYTTNTAPALPAPLPVPEVAPAVPEPAP